MIINIIYILIFSIFLFLLYLIIKSVVRGINEKNKKKIKDKD
jgi:TM2 domain-containing membrane protein YozV